ncbi:MAG: alpha/beta fold hydrolase [Bacteroidia bacterium]|nr:alpha/beta fold hydrolase [Bacteroidia bacterium]
MNTFCRFGSLIFFMFFSLFVLAQKELTVEEIWGKYAFFSKPVEGFNPLEDGDHYTVLEDDDINQYSYVSDEKIKTIFSLKDIGKEFSITGIDAYDFSEDESKILFNTETKHIYRHSYKASYYVWDIPKKKLTPVSSKGKQQLATFSPDGQMVAFVRENNIFIRNLKTDEEINVTNDGKINFVINGATDWVYEEEFSFSKAFAWSPDGAKLAFYRLDESQVKEFDMTMYGTLYPEGYKYKYPKAGEKNSDISIHIYDIKTKKTKPVDIGTEKDQYIPRILWTKDSNILSLIRLNRLQNKFELLLADANTGKSQVIYTETDACYVEIPDDDFLYFTDDKKSFIITSEKDGYNHFYQYDLNGNLIKQVTKGNWEILSFLGYDEKNKVIYFASNESSPMQKDIYSVSISGDNKKKLSRKSGSNKAKFSMGFKYFINTVSDANTPSCITINDAAGKEIRVVQDNAHIVLKMKEYGFAKKEFLKFKTSEGVELNTWMIKPLNFDVNKKYPVFMYQYGGPGSQEVKDEWDYQMPWFQMLAQKGYIIACVDNRGTGGRGAEFKKITYGQLGKFETIDQIEAAKYFGSLPYADAKRIGIWGWSYGGYMSILCVTKGAEYFKMAIAVAPVTNWRYYDSIYTERFMGLPQDNAAGYDDNSPINHVDKLKGKLLICHGTADDNVHLQNSMELVTKLLAANKQFDMMFYPNSNHGIYTGRYTRQHLYVKMTNYILENL